MSEAHGVSDEIAPYIDVKDLSYAFPDGSSGLQHVILNLPAGSRTLLIGGKFYDFLLDQTEYAITLVLSFKVKHLSQRSS